MCGIAGIVAPSERDLTAIAPMNDAQAHRGPDGQGVCLVDGVGVHVGRTVDELSTVRGRVALGHRRLAILDTTDAGLQPMANANRMLWITYNGEIYNFIELREELSALGHRFQTRTDTEVILAAYDQWGLECLSRFNGMWALALWDGWRRRVVLSRDRFGVKPLHFRVVNGVLVFASEIKALLAYGSPAPRLNFPVAADFLRFGVVNHSDETFFAEVRAFPAGCVAEIDPDQPESWRPTPFWKPPEPGERGRNTLSTESARGRFRELLQSAISLRMRSDVRVGACLSGGLDSSSIVLMAAPLASDGLPFSTFNASADNPRFDESEYARMVAEQVGAESHYVLPKLDEFLADWPKLVHDQDEPFTSASMYAQWRLMRAARESGIKVLLDGQGGDEILCGYRKYVYFFLADLWRSRSFGRALGFLFGLLRRGDRGILNLWEGVRYLPGWLQHRSDGLAPLLRPQFSEVWRSRTLAHEPGHSVADRQVDDLLLYSIPSLLRYEDRNSMAWSVEARVPFLDYRLVEFMLRLPAEAKLCNGETKAIMRKALRGIVPDAILDRRDKMGFVTPQADWMRGPMQESIDQALTDPEFRLGDLLDGHAARGLAHTRGYWAVSHQNALFRVFALESWARAFNVQIR